MPQDYESLFNKASQTQQDVMGDIEASTKLPDMLRQAVTERFKSSPLYGERESAAENLLTTGSDTRAELAQMGQSGDVVMSPTQQASVMSRRKAAAVTPLMTLNDLLNIRTGGTENAINQTMIGYNTMLGAKQNYAQDLYNQAQDAWQRDMSEREYNLKAQKASGGGLGSLLSGLAGMSAQPTEPKPMMTPTSGTGTLSAGGEWQFTGNDWEPVQQSTDGLGSLITPELLMSGIISGDLSSADANALATFSGLKPSAQQTKQKQIGEEQSYAISTIDRLIDLLEGGIKTGPFSGRALKFKGGTLGGLSPQEQEAYNLIGKIGAKQVFELGGKTLPAQEMARLDPFSLSYTTPTETNLQNLNELKNELESIYGEALNSSNYELIEY